MIDLDAASVLFQWSTGGLFFLWVTGRRRQVGLGYGWTMRAVYGSMGVVGLVVGLSLDPVPVREAAGVGMVASTVAATVVSIICRRAGVAGQRIENDRRSSRVTAMTGIDTERESFDSSVSEFPPRLDLLAPAFGFVAVVSAGLDAGEPAVLSVARMLVGAAFLGVVSDAMLLGHWYLVQPGLARGPLLELVRWTSRIWPFELAVLLWPTGMVSVLDGTIDDGYNGLLGWFWVACVVATIALATATRAALRERQYSAVMAATGLLYLAVLTAFGMDLVARAMLT
ncbi:MAG TPA: hypothetical protein DGF10_05415 [Acidimicrobiaceae bacterium]|nr:hypothetical protein [Acidimicrobiaceae bacterium]HCV34087.1 hypothetical protein [Acidimicrobiaceae bacterium]